MALLTISGTTITPEPSDYSVGIMDIVEAIRNGNGKLIADKKATKRKIELGWKYLTRTQLATLLTLFNSNFIVSVIYVDPQTGANKTGNFYCSDRNQGCFRMDGGVITGWKDVKFSLVEV